MSQPFSHRLLTLSIASPIWREVLKAMADFLLRKIGVLREGKVCCLKWAVPAWMNGIPTKITISHTEKKLQRTKKKLNNERSKIVAYNLLQLYIHYTTKVPCRCGNRPKRQCPKKDVKRKSTLSEAISEEHKDSKKDGKVLNWNTISDKLAEIKWKENSGTMMLHKNGRMCVPVNMLWNTTNCKMKTANEQCQKPRST